MNEVWESFEKEREIAKILAIVEREDIFTSSFIVETMSCDFCFSEY